MVDFGIPLFANIHLCGSVLTEVFFVMTISRIFYGSMPSPGTMVLFCLLLGIFAIGAPGVPGGTVMASLGLITGILLFDDTGDCPDAHDLRTPGQLRHGMQRDRRRGTDSYTDRICEEASCGKLTAY